MIPSALNAVCVPMDTIRTTQLVPPVLLVHLVTMPPTVNPSLVFLVMLEKTKLEQVKLLVANVLLAQQLRKKALQNVRSVRREPSRTAQEQITVFPVRKGSTAGKTRKAATSVNPVRREHTRTEQDRALVSLVCLDQPIT